MKKVLEYIKKHYMLFTVIAVALLLVIASLITISIINGNRHKIVTKTDKQMLYQYVGDHKKSFSSTITYEDEKITKVEAKEYSLIDSPLYYEDSSKVIVPYKSEIVFYYRDNLTYRMPKYSTLEKNNDVNKLNIDGKYYNLDNFIIFDGKDTYLLPYQSTLILDGEKIGLSALSYVIANRATFMYYDYENDTFMTRENVKVANLHMNDIDIDLYGDVVVYNKKNNIIVNDIDNYPVYKED